MRKLPMKLFVLFLFMFMQSAFGQVTHTICIGEKASECEGKPHYGCNYNNGAGVRTIATAMCGGSDKFSNTWAESNLHEGHQCGYKFISFTCTGSSNQRASSPSLDCVKMSKQLATTNITGIIQKFETTITNNCTVCVKGKWNFFQDGEPMSFVDYNFTLSPNQSQKVEASPTKPFGNMQFKIFNLASCN